MNNLTSKETTTTTINGWFGLVGCILLIGLGFFFLPLGIPFFILGAFGLAGLFTLQPNEAQVLLLFGTYKGTVRASGFHWVNPFYFPSANRNLKLSLRVRNFQSERLKVNDKRGNPVEIAAVIVWRIVDTTQALFDVDNYRQFVEMQSESAIRHVATSYPYDHGDDEEQEITLRGNVEVIAEAIRNELQERLEKQEWKWMKLG